MVEFDLVILMIFKLIMTRFGHSSVSHQEVQLTIYGQANLFCLALYLRMLCQQDHCL